MSKEFLKKVEAGTAVVKMLSGGGYKTYEVYHVEEVTVDGIFLEGADGDYSDESTYKYSKINGRAENNYVPNFRSEIVRIATEEDLRKAECGDEIED